MPQPGQEHRSSGNFSTQGAPNGTDGLYWEILDHRNSDNRTEVSFDVMEDVPLGIDPIIFERVHSGANTPYHDSRSLYIANPRGAAERFTVAAYPTNG